MAAYDDLSGVQFDILREIGNIGAGNATTALSQMLGAAKIDMAVPSVKLLGFSELVEVVGGAESLAAGVMVNIDGDLEGSMLFMLEHRAAHHLVDNLLGSVWNEQDDFTEMDLSALGEIGNIIVGAYLSSVSLLTGLSVHPSIPYLAVDMSGAILSVPAIEFGKLGDKALLIESTFSEDGKHISGYFILIPTEDSYGKLLHALGQ